MTGRAVSINPDKWCKSTRNIQARIGCFYWTLSGRFLRALTLQIFQNEFFQYRPILAVKFLTASRVCVAKVGAGIKKEPPLREALGEISFAVIFLHKESFGSSTSLMPYK